MCPALNPNANGKSKVPKQKQKKNESESDDEENNSKKKKKKSKKQKKASGSSSDNSESDVPKRPKHKKHLKLKKAGAARAKGTVKIADARYIQEREHSGDEHQRPMVERIKRSSIQLQTKLSARASYEQLLGRGVLLGGAVPQRGLLICSAALWPNDIGTG